MELYFSSAKTKTMTPIAIAAGWLPGAQLTASNTVYFAPQFSDQDWKFPDLETYRMLTAKWKPRCASVLDWEREEQFAEVMEWAEEVAPSVDYVIIIPKVIGGVARIPGRVGNRPVRLGFSVPTSHGGTGVPIHEFGRRPVHLLGGAPQKQIRLATMLNVVSVDGNYIQREAMSNRFFSLHRVESAKNKAFPQLKEVGDGHINESSYLEAFARSAENVVKAWKRFEANDLSGLPLFA